MSKKRSKPPIVSVRARWLGERMRGLREERGLTLKYVAAFLGVEFSTLARYERAEWPFRRDHVVALLDVYGVYDETERTQLVQLAQDAWRINQWEQDFDGTVYDTTFIDYPWLESRAEEICAYSAMTVPGLLQTPAYAEALIRAYEGGADAAEHKVQKWLNLRMERQRVLNLKNGPTLSVIVDEAVLRRPVGDRKVQRDQLAYLRDAGRRPKMEIRVLPSSVGVHPGLDGTFFVFRMPAPYPAVSYVEHLGGRLFMEATRAVCYSEAYSQLWETALRESESVALIANLVEELS
jgi:transcriptional regulator with XRE-family HTH domain